MIVCAHLACAAGVRSTRRVAAEDAVAARRRADALGVERPAHLERVDAIHPVLAAAGREHLLHVVGLGKGAAPERDADPVRAGGGGEADVLQAGVRLVQGAVLHLIVELHVLFAANDGLVDHLAVQGHDQRVLELHPAAPDIGHDVGDIHHVFAIRRQIHVGEDAAAGAERQASHVRQLRAGSRRGTSSRRAGHRAGQSPSRPRRAPRSRTAR